MQSRVEKAGFERTTLTGTAMSGADGQIGNHTTPLRHVAWVAPALEGEPSVVHVYIEGDGRPWATRERIARDPTPRMPLMLELMVLDPAASVYIARPCYFGEASVPPCEARLWTSARYGAWVVSSLRAALADLGQRNGWTPDERPALRLIGHSGGGVLAMLLAARLADDGVPLLEVVTLAANLDVSAWAKHHGYTPLSGSLDPAREAALPAHVAQRHFAGANDRQVPAWVTRRGLRHQPSARLEVIDGFGHHCCWKRAWPELLSGQ